MEGAIRSGDIPVGSLILLEFDSPKPMESIHLGTARGNYWLNTSTMYQLFTYCSTCIEENEQDEFLENYLLGWIQNIFHWGQFKGMAGDLIGQYSLGEGRNTSGFLSLEEEANIFPDSRAHFSERRTELLADTLVLLEQANRAREVRSIQNKEYCDRLSQQNGCLLDWCREHQIELVFILPPNTLNAMEWNVFQGLPKDRVIDMGDPDNYPEFYQTNYRFDRGHLNEVGAALYTRKLAERILELDLDLDLQ
ncbi:MAG: hypothetical protein R2818_15780 [Flavobacteriales bacterium]